MSFIPIIAIGAAIVLIGGKKRRKNGVKKPKSLPAPPKGTGNGYGDIFEGASPPDLIAASVGEKFSIRFEDTSLSSGYTWDISASPPDNSIELLREKIESPKADMPGAPSIKYFVFKGAKAGKGSLVFHLQAPWLKGKELPTESVEIQTEIR